MEPGCAPKLNALATHNHCSPCTTAMQSDAPSTGRDGGAGAAADMDSGVSREDMAALVSKLKGLLKRVEGKYADMKSERADVLAFLIEARLLRGPQPAADGDGATAEAKADLHASFSVG